MIDQGGCKWLQDNNSMLSSCVEEIVNLFRFDTIVLLDCVLTDDQFDPEYSANIVYERLQKIVDFQKYYYGMLYNDVREYLLANGYTKEEIQILNQKRIDENLRHTQSGDCSMIDI